MANKIYLSVLVYFPAVGRDVSVFVSIPRTLITAISSQRRTTKTAGSYGSGTSLNHVPRLPCGTRSGRRVCGAARSRICLVDHVFLGRLAGVRSFSNLWFPDENLKEGFWPTWVFGKMTNAGTPTSHVPSPGRLRAVDSLWAFIKGTVYSFTFKKGLLFYLFFFIIIFCAN